MSKDYLLVGSGLEAKLAQSCLAELGTTATLHHLPVPSTEPDFTFVRRGVLASDHDGPKKVRVTDVWGKSALELSLPDLVFVESGSLQAAKSFPAGLTVTRTSTGEDGVLAVLSDGTDFLCRGVIFADGRGSQAHKFWDKPAKLSQDPYTVKAWSFVAPNFQELKTWDFRWAAAKSVELIPLPEGRIWVKLRFKSNYGTNLSVPELRDLFSEFGSDMAGLFEDLTDEAITFSEECQLSHSVFSPAPGCVALGRAVWSTDPMLCFDWLSHFVDRQLKILGEQIRLESWNSESFEAQCRDALKTLSQAERFARKHLHNDNPFLRPLRNFIVGLLPNSILAPQLKKRLFL